MLQVPIERFTIFPLPSIEQTVGVSELRVTVIVLEAVGEIKGAESPQVMSEIALKVIV